MALAAASMLLLPLAATAATPNAFNPTGSMVTPRAEAAAAPLPDGRVLIAGGTSVPPLPLDTAEIYNPVTGTFTLTTGHMGTARRQLTAAPLPGGKVLIVGGTALGGASLNTTEIFDPATQTFTPGPNLLVHRSKPAVAPLSGGLVLVAGGYDSTTVPNTVATSEIVNTATNSSTPGPNLGAARFAPAAAPLPNGEVLVTGGNDGGPQLATAEIYNPTTNTFGPTTSMNTARYVHAAAPLPDGSPLFVGGLNTPTPLASAEIYSPASNTFSATASMSAERPDVAAAKIPDGVLVAGGSGATVLGSAELYLVAPGTKIDAGPNAKVKTKKPKAKVTFTFSSDIVGSTFNCTLATKPAKTAKTAKTAKKKKKKKPIVGPCTSPKTYKVKPGKSTFSVAASSQHAIPDATPATQSFKVKPKA